MVVDSGLKNRFKPAPLSKNPGIMKTVLRRNGSPELANQADANRPPKITTIIPTGNKIDPTSFRPFTLFGRGIQERPTRDMMAPVQPSQ